MSRTKDLGMVLNEVNAKYSTSKAQVALQGLFIDIAIAISRMRGHKGVSQRELAKKLNTAQSTVARWETPGYSSYTLTKLNEIASILGYTLQLAFKDRQEVNTKTITCGDWAVGGSINQTHRIIPRPIWPIIAQPPMIIKIEANMQEVRL